MTLPDKGPKTPEKNVALWVVVGMLAAIVVGGLTYGLSHPKMDAGNPPETVGSAVPHSPAQHGRGGRSM